MQAGKRDVHGSFTVKGRLTFSKRETIGANYSDQQPSTRGGIAARENTIALHPADARTLEQEDDAIAAESDSSQKNNPTQPASEPISLEQSLTSSLSESSPGSAPTSVLCGDTETTGNVC